MRDAHTPLTDVVDSFLVHRHDLSPTTVTNYRHAIRAFIDWCEISIGRTAEVGDVEPGTVEAYLSFRKTSSSAQCARVGWVSLRSLAKFLAERRIHHENGESTLRAVRMPKVKDDSRRALTDEEMWRLLQRAEEGEMGHRDSTIIWTLLGCGLRREELANLRLGDIDLRERRLHIRAATSKSVHSRDVTIPIEALKALDGYLNDHRDGETDEDAPVFTDRRGRSLTGNAIRKLFERLKVRTGIRDLCAHMLRHTWATNFHRSGSGSRFDLMVEGGWTTGRMVERYTKARPFEERRRAPSPFTAARKAAKEKRPSEMRPPQQGRGLAVVGTA
ncbi:MAG TPA: tyrosine-type recombinase/integrase [Candidatus Limnocylindria bacterium]|nr:tyrosine-type recombinase/integrase [Candidatus Limnocylindria bacterium]